jgi:hypothetical protein
MIRAPVCPIRVGGQEMVTKRVMEKLGLKEVTIVSFDIPHNEKAKRAFV